MKNKIDDNILCNVKFMSKSNEKIDCIIFSNNYNLLLNQINFNNKSFIDLPFISAIGVKISFNEVVDLSKLNCVEYICGISKVSTMMNVSRKVMNTKVVENNVDEQFCVAIIDTGIYPHLDFCIGKNRLVKFVDLINDKKYFYDDNGHGTFTAGVFGSTGIVSNGKYKGIDANINIISIKALDENGETGAINILKAMQWIYDNKDIYNIRVVCMSFGAVPINMNDPLILGAETLWDSGIVVVSAGGNSGPESATIKAPGASSKIITVGALNDNRENDKFDEISFEVADFSSRGPAFIYYKPDLLAPGVNIKSTCNFELEKKFYSISSGTSVSTPMIAGVCSSILAKHKFLNPNQIKNLLLKSCIKLTGDRNIEGFGYLNLKNLII